MQWLGLLDTVGALTDNIGDEQFFSDRQPGMESPLIPFLECGGVVLSLLGQSEVAGCGSTDYHALYWANLLALKGPSGTLESLSRSIANARVDLNPHQVDAALFALRSPLSKGAILADEVGLGKTIEAGIVITQRWAERRRRLLLILPATLRKQWQQELEEKFSLPTLILEAKSFNRAKKAGAPNPFDQKERVVIVSYQFAAAKSKELAAVPWDLVVMDEAHRLRNVYKPGNKTANAIASALAGTPKILLTATPLQNSLLELYGLVSVIDPHVFGDLDSFKEQFSRTSEEGRYTALKERLAPVCTRTLRKQVLEYIRFTQRIALTQEFLPSDDEHRLYEDVSAYLQRRVLLALPASQRHLLTLVLRKLLASSTFAIAGTLRTLVRRLEEMQQGLAAGESPLTEDDFEPLEGLEEEWEEEPSGASAVHVDPVVLQEELDALREYLALAEGISQNAKGTALLTALSSAFHRAEELGAPRKAVIFTESRRTQSYLFELLSRNGYEGDIVLINGSNADATSKAIYEEWLKRRAGTDAVSGSRSADMKAALVEAFREKATLLLATESAAEGVNLQFCSLVVNYDLPWNPQRVEQRIGRCHRYGQKHDVVVVNFLNKRNEADQRVYQLLAEKFSLFDGVFGASDEVLGALESGVDLERRIADVYQTCRTAEEIQAAFDALQSELDEKISLRMEETRQALLENFDEDVHRRLKMHREQAQAALDLRQQWLYALTQHELAGTARFYPDSVRFHYAEGLEGPGFYNLDWKDAEVRGDHFYRPDHPLAQTLIDRARARTLPVQCLRFDLRNHPVRISALEPYLDMGGWLELHCLTVHSLEAEEFLFFVACTHTGVPLDDELCRKMLSLAAIPGDGPPLNPLDLFGGQTGAPGEPAGEGMKPPARIQESLAELREQSIQKLQRSVDVRNGAYLDEENAKLDHWADDLKFGLERELKEIDRSIKDARRASSIAVGLAEKLAAQKLVKDLESSRNRKRRELYDAQDAIDRKRAELIEEIERQMRSENSAQALFMMRWELR